MIQTSVYFLIKQCVFYKCHNLSTRFVLLTNPFLYQRLNRGHMSRHSQYLHNVFWIHHILNWIESLWDVLECYTYHNKLLFFLSCWVTWDTRCFIHVFLTWNQHKNNLHLVHSPPRMLFIQCHGSSLIIVVKVLSSIALLSITIALDLACPILSNIACKVCLNTIALWPFS